LDFTALDDGEILIQYGLRIYNWGDFDVIWSAFLRIAVVVPSEDSISTSFQCFISRFFF
jgi:hypothetical protein